MSAVTIRNVDVTVTGLPIGGSAHATRFELVTAVNDIPYIVLDLLPIPIKPAASGNISKSTSSESDFFTAYNTLVQKAEERFKSPTSGTKASVKISLAAKDAHGKSEAAEQNLELKDWILTDVALSSVGPVAAPMLTVVLKHPAEVLDRIGEIYETPQITDILRVLQESNITGASNMIDLLDKMYTLFANDSPIIYYPPVNIDGGSMRDSANTITQFRKNILSNLPSTHIEDQCGLFLQGSDAAISGEAQNLLKISIALSISNFDKSIFRTVINSICPICVAQVVPVDYDQSDKLKLEPCNPWQSTAYTLEGDIIESIYAPSQDRDPIIGVAMLSNAYDYPNRSDQKAQRIPVPRTDGISAFKNTFYIPGAAKSGRIEQIGENAVIGLMRDLNTATISSDGKVESIADCLDYKTYVRMCQSYAAGVFQCLYRKNCISSVTTVATFSDSKNKKIYPGRSLSIKIGQKDTIHGYLTRMVIRGSTEGDCTSTFELSSSRSASGDVIIKEGSKNPCYNK